MIDKLLTTRNSNYIKGISAIMICISHIVDNSFPSNIVFLKDGSLWVGIFLFLSGYGLVYSFYNKKNYLKNFFKNKILKLYIPVVIAEIIYIIVYSCFFSYSFSFVDIVLGILCIKNINTAFWYIQLTFIIYFIFYILYKNNKIKNKCFILIEIYVIYMIFSIILDKLVGIDTWWYISLSCFVLGVLCYEYKDLINKILESKIIKIINVVSIILLLVFIILLNHSLVYRNNFLGINNNYFLIMLDIVFNPLFCCTFIYNFCRINIASKILNVLGNNSMLIYFYHRIAIKLFTEKFIINNCYIRLILILIVTFVISFIYNFIKEELILCKKKLM